MNTPIDPLSGFRPDGYGLDDERRARMRARVLDAIPDDPPVAVGTLTTPRLVEVPLVRVEAPDATEPDDLHVLEPLSLDDRRVGPREARSRRSNSRRLLAAAAVAVALGLLAVVVGTSRSSDRPVGTLDESSDVTLDHLADIAADQHDATLVPGQYQYVEITTATRQSAGGGFVVELDRNWHMRDGSGRRTTTQMVQPAGALPGAYTDRREPGSIDDPAGDGLWFGPFGYDAMRIAPTDPATLLTAASDSSQDRSPFGLAEQIMLLESLTTTPPAVRAAGLRALDVLGFRPIGTVADPFGRSGLAYSLDSDRGTEVLVFDPLTGAALSHWTADLGSATTFEAAGTWHAFNHAAITDSTSSPAG